MVVWWRVGMVVVWWMGVWGVASLWERRGATPDAPSTAQRGVRGSPPRKIFG